MRVTIKDVAKIANVSPSTVSRVITNNPKISEATREKVWDAMKELNYHPNVTARKLATSATKTLGLLLPNDAESLAKNPFFIQVLTGITSYAQDHGYYIMIANAGTEEEEIDTVKHLINSNLIDGVIMTILREDDQCVKFLQENDHPYVIIGKPNNTEDILWVDNDNFQAMYEVVNHVIRNGNKKIAFIGGHQSLTVTQNRFEGYEMALKNRGLTVDRKLIKEVEFDENAGYLATLELLNEETPDAIVTTDDLIAIGAMKALQEKGIIDISVSGFNNIPGTKYQNPTLTSVEIHADMLGHYAAKLLIDKLQHVDTNLNNYIVDTDLKKRASTEIKR